jgi:hypothetical protein
MDELGVVLEPEAQGMDLAPDLSFLGTRPGTSRWFWLREDWSINLE